MANTTTTPQRIEYGKKPDVTFIFPNDGDAVLLAERHHLARSSKIFQNQFSSSTNDIDGKIVITDISFDIFNLLLQHIYEGNVIVNSDNFSEVLYASRKYFIYDLVKITINFIMIYINYNNVIDYFEFVDMFDLSYLNDHIRNVIIKNPLDIIGKLNKSAPHMRILKIILESEVSFHKEYELYDAIRKIMSKIVDDSVCNIEEKMREQFGKMIYLIRFPTMSTDELINCAKPPSLLTTKQVVDLLLWKNARILTETIELFCTTPRVMIEQNKCKHCSNPFTALSLSYNKK